MTANEIARRLAAHAEDVCHHLLPNGVRKGRDWCCGSLQGDAGDSLKICLEGPKAGVWSDFADQGKTGDLIGLWRAVKGQELGPACQEAQDWLGIPEYERNGQHPAPSRPIPTPGASETWLRLQERMRPGTDEELDALAALRGLPSIGGLNLATEHGQLFFGPVFDDDRDYPAWIVTDSTRRNAQARRMDGQIWAGIKAKAKTIKGCEASWPIGAVDLNGNAIAVTEGGPDFLSAWHIAYATGRDLRPIGMLGASNAIHPDALPALTNHPAYVFPHIDKSGAGQAAGARWAAQLGGATIIDLAPHGVKDLNDLVAKVGGTDPQKFIDLLAPPAEDFSFGEPEPAPGQASLGKDDTPLRALSSFTPPPDGDLSVLLGDRYLSKGDGAVLSGTSGIGKSVLALQLAILWALGRLAFGIKPNGALRMLIIQSEDSDGDIGEMWWSLKKVMGLTPEEITEVDDRVKIANERVLRGSTFVLFLKRAIAQHRPDLVIINPLQAFMDGDVTDSQDIGSFLRGHLNSLNNPPSFAYLLIHHTTKPATGRDKADRLWHEVMYDMAGGAEIINWARAILSLRPAEQEGTFNLVLAKRGRRAGVVRSVPQGAGWRDEPVTTIALAHAKGFLPVPGRAKEMPVMFWEGREADPQPEKVAKGGGRPSKYLFSDFSNIFPTHSGEGLEPAPLHRLLLSNRPDMPKGALDACLKRWMEEGTVEVIIKQGIPRRYRAAV